MFSLGPEHIPDSAIFVTVFIQNKHWIFSLIMLEQCVLGGCNQTRGESKLQWVRWPSDNHFEDSMFENFVAWSLGAGKLKLKQGAVPTLRNKRHAGKFNFLVVFYWFKTSNKLC